ncbi:aminoglycoside phosphotransferase family protein [Deinococcus sp. AJ005]|uniref:aminoglycoside phosphotransferase family protein n=1 Tax=Deinococcus sp. AJ005 TaxID=2652443 RepID=UPI00125CB065|nr:aminoglycoside phosphotransferase family protein [Deinococcus sp. AJ005]QFP77532.1 aminoglycoside phosphotransferase family protein [Deinococcus sp. AJ005]
MDFTALIEQTFPGSHIGEVSALSGGYANDLFRVGLDGASFPSVIVRQWRRAPGVAARELAVMARAAQVVPVPRILASALNTAHPFALLEDMPGMRGDEALAWFPDEAEAIGAVLGGAFSRIGALQFEAPGLFADETLRVDAFTGDAADNLLAYAHPLIWNDAARAVLGAQLQAGWWGLIEREAPCLCGLEPQRSLVHADANTKNVLVERRHAGWQVSAVLDWEFALSGPPLMDLGNLLRFENRAGTPFSAGVLRGWSHPLPDAVRQARALDVYSLLDFVNRPNALQANVLALIRWQVQTDSL